MDDIKPPRRPIPRPVPPTVAPTPPVIPPEGAPMTAPQPISEPVALLSAPKKTHKKLKWIIISIATLIVIIVASGLLWYRQSLSAKGGTLQQLVLVTVKQGSTPNQIGQLLQDKAVIQNAVAFDIYVRVSGNQNKLQAGTYRLSPAESVSDIVEHLVNGKIDQFSIRFLPGATLAQDRQVLIDAGYSATDVDKALAETYDSPLFDTKPAGTSLEGYIYGETYNFNTGTTVEDILNRAFAQYEKVITDNNLVAGFSHQGLTLYQGITLASIVQREVESATDQAIVAQVFYKRLAIGIALGSDVTYIYAAGLLGVTPSPSLDSPYNTRINTGLPPGPIATPGMSALIATADPASTDYLYFLSGDDGKTYFSTNEAGHEANISAHCQVKCSQ